MLKIWRKIAEELVAGRRIFLAVVVGHEKGSPGTAGAHLMVTEKGDSFGTIGGGIMEARLLEEARDTLRTGSARHCLRILRHTPSSGAESSGLICGGAQSLVTTVLGSESTVIVEEVLSKLGSGKSGSLLFSSIGLTLEDEDLDKPSAFVEGTAENWEARLGLFNRHRVLIAGGGHCGSALAKQMKNLDFHVTVVEPRFDLPLKDELPEEVCVINKPFNEAGESVDHERLTFVVVMTPSYSDDIEALASLLPRAFPFIGIMGSPVKLKKIHNELLDCGFDETDWERLTAPVGLLIESDTPAEIAVSIAAQILQQTKQFDF